MPHPVFKQKSQQMFCLRKTKHLRMPPVHTTRTCFPKSTSGSKSTGTIAEMTAVKEHSSEATVRTGIDASVPVLPQALRSLFDPTCKCTSRSNISCIQNTTAENRTKYTYLPVLEAGVSDNCWHEPIRTDQQFFNQYCRRYLLQCSTLLNGKSLVRTLIIDRTSQIIN